MKSFSIVVVATFGLESVVKNEIIRMGYSIDKVENGSIYLNGDIEVIATLNQNLRCAERVFILMGQFASKTWEDLYQGVKNLEWLNILNQESCFPVNAKSVKSKLFSLSDIQAISKKAIVEHMKLNYKIEWFAEQGAKVPIHVNILNDIVSVLIDTSGAGLHRRGYRALANDAPLKETLAAGLVQLSRWNAKGPLYDPFCGTGTILIEAAMIMRNIPPGLNKKPVFETWSVSDDKIIKSVRVKGYEQIIYDRDVLIVGTDIDPRAIRTAMKNAELAGVDDCINFSVKALADWEAEAKQGCIITNPPYGERLEDKDSVSILHKKLREKVESQGISLCNLLTSHEHFEQDFGIKADKNRKLYNGNIKCYFYQYKF